MPNTPKIIVSQAASGKSNIPKKFVLCPIVVDRENIMLVAGITQLPSILNGDGRCGAISAGCAGKKLQQPIT